MLFYLLLVSGILRAQNTADSIANTEPGTSADDPSQFFTRTELFSEWQHYNRNASEYNLNQTTLRTVVKLGKRFTTRLDVPVVYNSFDSPNNFKQFGLGDISFRLLGYKFLQTKKSAITASMEISLNTAQSPLLGTGKNILLPMFTYTTAVMDKRMLLAVVLQEAFSFSGDEAREPLSFTKLQGIMLYSLSRKTWFVVAPEMYLDYVHGGASMNLEARFAYAPVKRVNIWVQAGSGIFGDFVARYQWGGEAGCRYFFLRNTMIKGKIN